MIAITIATAPHPRKNDGISKIEKEALVPDIIFNSVEIDYVFLIKNIC